MAVEPPGPAGLNTNFDVYVRIAAAPTPYWGYNSVLKWIPDPVTPGMVGFVGHDYLEEGGLFSLCGPAVVGTDKISSGCSRFSGTTNSPVRTDRITLQCTEEGLVHLHLVASGEAALFTATLGSGGTVIPTGLTDAVVNCVPCIDRLGDTSCDDPVNDPDDDGCTTVEETALNGGDSSPFDATINGWYDVCDMPVPAKPDAAGANGPKDKVVDMRDVLAVLFYAFTEPTGICGDNPNSNGVDYDCVKGVDLDGDTDDDAAYSHGIPEGQKYDRTAGLNPDPVTAVDPCGPPDNVIDMRDVLAVLAQAFVVDCSGP
jgi:hypothetical protein